MKQYSIGIDIGSTCAKAVVLDAEKHIMERFLLPTGWSSVETAEKLKEQLSAYLSDAFTVATGYGRACVPFADRSVTEITCHGKGAAFLYSAPTLTVIDIGGQDTKIILLENGTVSDFLMNDKCSAGTGRFLEVMANTLGLRLETLCELASAGGGVSISSMCTVFAESEVISLIGRGEPRENIAFAVVDSIVTKVASQVSRLLQADGAVCLTGGLCELPYLRQALEKKLGRKVVTSSDGRYAGAIGAALLAWKDGAAK
ncbi:MAG: CoA activase [Oscillospiraceae bacterium]|nr:CoA activase [Oscillospiraceae bacterium]